MAGHSKWKNIQHRKGRQDAIKGKIFTKLTKEIYAAVRSGGDDPNSNGALRQALQKAKQNNLPNSNIENAIKKAMGNVDGVQYEEIIYEGYGPGGAAVMVEALTDNRNRTAAEIRFLFSKNGGNLGENGCVSFLFDRKGLIRINVEQNETDGETVMMEALEAEVEDVELDGSVVEITTTVEAFEQVRQTLDDKGYRFEQAEITRIPSTTVQLSGEEAKQMIKLIEALEDNDDVQNVHANFETDDDVWDG